MKNAILAGLLTISLILNIGTIVFLNGYFKYADSIQDVNNTISGEERGTQGKVNLNFLDRKLEKKYQALSRKLGGKYYFNNKSEDKIIVKSVYYLDGQTVKAKILKKDGKELNGVYSFNSLVASKKTIDSIIITEINGSNVGGEIIFKGEDLGKDKKGINIIS